MKEEEGWRLATASIPTTNNHFFKKGRWTRTRRILVGWLKNEKAFCSVGAQFLWTDERAFFTFPRGIKRRRSPVLSLAILFESSFLVVWLNFFASRPTTTDPPGSYPIKSNNAKATTWCEFSFCRASAARSKMNVLRALATWLDRRRSGDKTEALFISCLCVHPCKNNIEKCEKNQMCEEREVGVFIS